MEKKVLLEMMLEKANRENDGADIVSENYFFERDARELLDSDKAINSIIDNFKRIELNRIKIWNH